MKRRAVGIWSCKACKKTIAGGAWTVSTTAAATVRRYAGLLIPQGLLDDVRSQHDSPSARNHRGLDPDSFPSSVLSHFHTHCSHVFMKYKPRTFRYLCVHLWFSRFEQGKQLLPNQCLKYQLNSPSARIWDFPRQRFAFHVCAPARLCL